MTSAAPGWYPDPNGQGGQRYFDGTSWGPAAPTATAPPPPQKKPVGCFRSVLGVIGVLFLIGLVGSQCDHKTSTTSSTTSSSSRTATTSRSAYAAPTATEAPPAPTPKYTPGQQNAIDKAESYLDYTAFSREGLIKQLEYDNFSTADATFAVSNLEASSSVDWNEQAVKKAKNYLDYTSFSLSGLIDQLKYDGFTSEQAQYGANKAYGS